MVEGGLEQKHKKACCEHHYGEEDRLEDNAKKLDVKTIKVLRLSLGREASGPAGP